MASAPEAVSQGRYARSDSTSFSAVAQLHMPGGFQAVYEGTKSFLQSFAEAVANELKARTDGAPDYLCLSPERACLPGTKP
jgi:hypothetical protein